MHTHAHAQRERFCKVSHIGRNGVIGASVSSLNIFINKKNQILQMCTYPYHPPIQQPRAGSVLFIYLFIYFYVRVDGWRWIWSCLYCRTACTSNGLGFFFRLCSTIKRQGKIQSPYVCNKHVCCVSVALVLLLGGLVTGI